MPCIAKKGEIAREELKVDGIRTVDHVLTTRELGELLRRKEIDLARINPQEADKLLGNYSGAGVIYGATGGVMESALRTAYKKLTGEELPSIDLTPVRGLADLKRAEIKIGDLKVTVGVINGLVNIEKLLAELKENPHSYDYIEVMACRGGCIGGGGQPLPINDEVREKRIEVCTELIRAKRRANSSQQSRCFDYLLYYRIVSFFEPIDHRPNQYRQFHQPKLAISKLLVSEDLYLAWQCNSYELLKY